MALPIRGRRAGPAVRDLIEVSWRIQVVVAFKQECGAMHAVGARSRDGRDHPARGPSIFRGGHAGVDLELLDPVHPQVGAGRPTGSTVGVIVDIGSIQHEAVRIAAAPADTESRPRAIVERSAGQPSAHGYHARLK